MKNTVWISIVAVIAAVGVTSSADAYKKTTYVEGVECCVETGPPKSDGIGQCCNIKVSNASKGIKIVTDKKFSPATPR